MTETTDHLPDEPTRPDLQHEDKIATRTPDEMPDAAREQDRPATLDIPPDATSFDDDVPDDADLTHSSPANEPLGKAPAM